MNNSEFSFRFVMLIVKCVCIYIRNRFEDVSFLVKGNIDGELENRKHAYLRSKG